jgi:hypothetical protein
MFAVTNPHDSGRVATAHDDRIASMALCEPTILHSNRPPNWTLSVTDATNAKEVATYLLQR